MMVMTMKVIFALLIVLLVPATSLASFYNGNDLIEWVRSDDLVDLGKGAEIDAANASRLLGYVVGVHDAYDGKTICAPKGTTIGQTVEIVKKFTRNNPEIWSQPGDSLVLIPLEYAFPCKKKK